MGLQVFELTRCGFESVGIDDLIQHNCWLGHMEYSILLHQEMFAGKIWKEFSLLSALLRRQYFKKY